MTSACTWLCFYEFTIRHVETKENLFQFRSNHYRAATFVEAKFTKNLYFDSWKSLPIFVHGPWNTPTSVMNKRYLNLIDKSENL